MYRKPHVSTKKIDKEQQLQKKNQSVKKIPNFVAKPAPNMNRLPKIPVTNKQNSSNQNAKTIPQKVQKLQKLVQKMQDHQLNPQLQELLLKQINGIKSELKQIKTQIGMKGKNYQNDHYQQEEPRNFNQRQIQQDQNDQEQNIMKFNNNLNNSQNQNTLSSQREENYNNRHLSQVHNKNSNQNASKVGLKQLKGPSKKVLIDVGKIQPYMKDFKIDATKIQLPFYTGYHKKSSKPIVVKYCEQNKTMDAQIMLYQRFWKNIVKAKYICINKIIDINEPMATNVMVIQQNRCGLNQIEMPPLQIAQNLIRALQFFHECGYLYRNMHPSHVMMTYDNNIVIIDFKKMRRFVDIKGKHIEVVGDKQNQELDPFVSNSRIRKANQGRKDDLQCLGYLALYMLQGQLPWNIENMIQVRSKKTLNQLFGKYPGLLQFMITVHKLPTPEMPNYEALHKMLDK